MKEDLEQAIKDVGRLNTENESSATERQHMLEDMLRYAKATTEFYSSVHGSTLGDFPVINKSIIRSDYGAFLVPEDRIPGQGGESLVSHYTSGSTGIPFHVLQDTAAHRHSIATIKYYNSLAGHRPFEPIMKISMREVSGQSSNMFTYDGSNNLWYANLPSMNDTTLRILVERIRSEKIKLIRAYMSIIDDLTAFVADNGLELDSCPNFISIGELLSEPVRRRITDTLGLHIVSQYATEENGVLGQNETDAPGDVIRLNRAGHIIELLKMDSDSPARTGEMGRVVVTDLHNRAMPMIRYDIGDLAIPLETGPDGLPRTIRLTACRSGDIIHRTDGSIGTITIPPEIWSAKGLRQLQFEQTGIRNYVLHVNTSCPGALTGKEASLLLESLGSDATVSIDYLDCPPEVCAGKRKMIKQSCPEYRA